MSKFGSLLTLLLLGVLTGFSLAATYRSRHIDDKTLLLWPMPASVQSGDAELPIIGICDLKISLNKETGEIANAARALWEEYRQIIFGRGLANCPPETTAPASNTTQTANPTNTGNASNIAFSKALTLQVVIRDLTNVSSPLFTENEKYSLTLKHGEFSLNAETYAGFVRGLETFSQLVHFDLNDREEPQYYIPFTPLEIKDDPAFKYRGIMVDTTSNYLPVAALKNVINLMMYSKFNVLHLYLSHENRSTYFSSEFTKSTKAAGDFGYTDEDIKELQNYAKERAVHLLPEINIPFHVKAVANSDKLPSGLLLSCEEADKSKRTFLNPYLNPDTKDTNAEGAGIKNAYSYAVDTIQHLMKLNNKEVAHLGGLEFISQNCFRTVPEVRDLLEPKRVTQTYMEAIVKKLNNTDVPKMVWINSRNETLKEEHKDVIYQFYGTSGETSDFVDRSNSQVIISSIDLLWSTCGYSSNIHPAIDCKYRSWWNYYNLDFHVYFGKNIDKVLGAEVTAFGDMVSKETINMLLFPRSTALGERLWNKNRGTKIHKRLLAWIDRVRSRGFRIPPITNNYCESNVESCFGVLD